MLVFIQLINLITCLGGSMLLGNCFGWKVGVGIFLIAYSLHPIVKPGD